MKAKAKVATVAGATLTAIGVLAPMAAAQDTVLYLGGTCACWNSSTDADTIADGYLATRGQTQGLPYWAGLAFPASIPQGAQRLLATSKTVEGKQVWAGVSQGALIIHDAELRIMTMPEDKRPAKEDLSFVLIADEAGPNGVITQNPWLTLFVPVTDHETPYDEISIAKQYDGMADWPDRPNFLAVANAVMGMVYLHGDYSDADINKPGTVVNVVVNSQGGTTTYYVVPTDHLPLTQPLRDIARNTGLNLGLGPSAFTGPIDDLDKVLKPIIDSGYKRNDKPSTTTVKIEKPAEKKTEEVNDKPDIETKVKAEVKKLSDKMKKPAVAKTKPQTKAQKTIKEHVSDLKKAVKTALKPKKVEKTTDAKDAE